MSALFGKSYFIFWRFQADPHEWEARLSNGLVKGHAYSITAMKMVKHFFHLYREHIVFFHNILF